MLSGRVTSYPPHAQARTAAAAAHQQADLAAKEAARLAREADRAAKESEKAARAAAKQAEADERARLKNEEEQASFGGAAAVAPHQHLSGGVCAALLPSPHTRRLEVWWLILGLRLVSTQFHPTQPTHAPCPAPRCTSLP